MACKITLREKSKTVELVLRNPTVTVSIPEKVICAIEKAKILNNVIIDTFDFTFDETFQ